ncbi:hypothetical protein VW35_19465 [Devosia soli]|uniref:CobQ/CobB/MinD/ParA nucleotide binding domain-containing protein n=1 Tax=Devosia soli TaxID=361041 RepID=A0A0F5L0H5_9HYPH|nr:division plane positioning ATPase MipZ [Devosia soli]KKB75926.1 hypothetical protein VW35_19465 [Devosia soli]
MNTRIWLERFVGILFRHSKAMALVFFAIVFSAWATTQILRPSFSAVALIVVEPHGGILSNVGSQATLPKAPDNGFIDGMVEVMRAEPTFVAAADELVPLDSRALIDGLDVRPWVLDFFRIVPERLGDGGEDRASLVRLIRQSVTITRKGLTPVIAITGRAASAEVAADLANAVAAAYIELQLQAKIAAVEEARDLVSLEFSTVDQRASALDRQSDAIVQAMVAELSVDAKTAALAEPLKSALAERAVRVGQARQPLQLANLTGFVRHALMAQWVSIEQSAIDAKAEAADLRRRVRALDAEATLQRPDARLIASASVPAEPIWPDVKTVMGVAGLFGVALSFGAGFLLDGMAHGMRSTAELADAAGVTTAVAVPRLRPMRLDGVSHADAVIEAPISPFSESMRTLRVAVQRNLLPNVPGRIVVVTSANEGDGKTTIALGLARAFEATGQNVLLIDADVRSAALHRHIDAPLAGTFEDILSGRLAATRTAGMLLRDPLSKVSVLVNAGRSDAGAENLFGGAGFADVLRGARASFDTIVIDMPAMAWSAEAAYILPAADAAVVVASWGRTLREQMHDIIVTMRQANTVSLPIVPALSLQPAALRWPVRRYEPGYSAA